MNMEKIQSILAIVGAVVIGLPVVLRSIHAILVAIPGDQKEDRVAALIAICDKVSEIGRKFLGPQAK